MRSIIISIFLCFIYSTTTMAAETSAKNNLTKNGPAEQTKKMVAALKKVKKNKTATYNDVDTYIDFHLLTTESIAPHRAKFSNKQAKKFTRLFEALIRAVAYPQSSSFYAEAEISYQPAIIDGNKALVISETIIEKEDFEMTIGYEWTKTKKQWLLSDLLIDEDSLVKDYQNQFGRIIQKEGVDGLISKVAQKLLEIESEGKAK